MVDVETTPSTPFVDGQALAIPDSSASAQPATNSRPEPAIPYSWQERHPNVQIRYICDHQMANRALERLQSGPYGFDLEWKPTFSRDTPENPVALVQIANHETILLLQIRRMKEFPSKLKEFLLNPYVTKVGVGIQGDAKKIYRDWGADLKSCVDLALLARTVDNERWKGRYTDPLGLARLIAAYEDRALAKGKITRSNWERKLTEPQQIYAANDAHAGYVLYLRFKSMLFSVSPQPEAKCYTFDALGGRLYVPFGRTVWEPSNPDYNPGPPPPPRAPKTKNTLKSKESQPATPSDQIQSQVDCGSGNAIPLPALQPNPSIPRSSFTGASYLQSSQSPGGHSQPFPNIQGFYSSGRGNVGYAGSLAYEAPNGMQPQFPLVISPNDPRYPYSGLMAHPYGTPGFAPPMFPQSFDVETLLPWSTSPSPPNFRDSNDEGGHRS